MTIGLSRHREAAADAIRSLLEDFGAWVDNLARRMARPLPERRPVWTPGRTASIPDGRRVYAVGDIHGRADLLFRLLKVIDEDVSQGGFSGKPVLVFLGDYVDRGFQSRDVLDVLIARDMARYETYFLKGNHEAAMLQFLEDSRVGPRWAEFGGVETLVSYGVRPPRNRTSPEEWERAREELAGLAPPSHLEFLKALHLSARIGDYLFVHAGVKPGVSLEDQAERDLLWIRNEFLEDRQPFEAVIVHGHTPATRPYRDSRRIGIDTGAYLSGRLTAVRFQGESVEFFMTGSRVETGPAAQGQSGGRG